MEKITAASPTSKFQLRVVESLTRLETLAEATAEHLKRLNGSVARHEEKIGALQQGISEHQIGCPVRDGVESLRQDVEATKTAIASDAAGKRATAAWWHMLSPLLWFAVGGILVLFLTHSKEMLQVLSKP